MKKLEGKVALVTGASRGITINAIAPGGVETDMAAGYGHEYQNPDLNIPPEEMLKMMVAVGRRGMPADIANLVAFLVSDEAEWITGQTMHIDGGSHFGSSYGYTCDFSCRTPIVYPKNAYRLWRWACNLAQTAKKGRGRYEHPERRGKSLAHLGAGGQPECA